MLQEAIPTSVAALLRDIRYWQLPTTTYMAGGTAVAIYLRHRISLDIDLFTDKEFYCGPIISAIQQKHILTVINAAEKDTLIAIVDNIRFSLFNYPYPLIKPLVNNADYGIKLASPEDIAAMKVVAITQRGTAKDFVDLRAIMLVYKLMLDYLMGLVQRKYGVSREYEHQLKKSLVEMGEWNEVERFFKRLVLGR